MGFCIENKISISQFYYHKRRLANENHKSTTFHAISLNVNQNNIQEKVPSSGEVIIAVGTVSIVIPASEPTLIKSIAKELAAKC